MNTTPVAFLEQVKATQGERLKSSLKAVAQAPAADAEAVVHDHPIATCLGSGVAGFIVVRWWRDLSRTEDHPSSRLPIEKEGQESQHKRDWHRPALSLLATLARGAFLAANRAINSAPQQTGEPQVAAPCEEVSRAP
jgi:hypothetical protein